MAGPMYFSRLKLVMTTVSEVTDLLLPCALGGAQEGAKLRARPLPDEANERVRDPRVIEAASVGKLARAIPNAA